MLHKMEHTFWSLVLHSVALVDSQPSAGTDQLGSEGGWRTWGSPQNIWESCGDICPALPRGDASLLSYSIAWWHKHFPCLWSMKAFYSYTQKDLNSPPPSSLHSMGEASLHCSKTRKLQRYQRGVHWSCVLSLHTGCALQGEGPDRPRRSNSTKRYCQPYCPKSSRRRQGRRAITSQPSTEGGNFPEFVSLIKC